MTSGTRLTKLSPSLKWRRRGRMWTFSSRTHRDAALQGSVLISDSAPPGLAYWYAPVRSIVWSSRGCCAASRPGLGGQRREVRERSSAGEIGNRD